MTGVSLDLELRVFSCLCHLAWALTLVTPDRFPPYLDVKTTRLYPLVSIKFPLISWQLQDSIKTSSERKRSSVPISSPLSHFSHFLHSWPACPPFHLPPTSTQQARLSPAFRDSHSLFYFSWTPSLDIWSFVLCVGGFHACVCGNKKRTDRHMDRQCVLASFRVAFVRTACRKFASASLQPLLQKYYSAKLLDMISNWKPPQLCKHLSLSLSLLFLVL